MPGETSLARSVLVKYGDRDDVARNLRASFASEGWTGPASLHHIRRKEQIEKLLDGEDELNVRNFLNLYLESLKRQITTELENEERD